MLVEGASFRSLVTVHGVRDDTSQTLHQRRKQILSDIWQKPSLSANTDRIAMRARSSLVKMVDGTWDPRSRFARHDISQTAALLSFQFVSYRHIRRIYVVSLLCDATWLVAVLRLMKFDRIMRLGRPRGEHSGRASMREINHR